MEHKEFQGAFARRGSVHPTGASPHAKEDLHHPEAKSAAPHRQFSGISHSTPLLAQYTCSPGGGKKRKEKDWLIQEEETNENIHPRVFFQDQCLTLAKFYEKESLKQDRYNYEGVFNNFFLKIFIYNSIIQRQTKGKNCSCVILEVNQHSQLPFQFQIIQEWDSVWAHSDIWLPCV